MLTEDHIHLAGGGDLLREALLLTVRHGLVLLAGVHVHGHDVRPGLPSGFRVGNGLRGVQQVHGPVLARWGDLAVEAVGLGDDRHLHALVRGVDERALGLLLGAVGAGGLDSCRLQSVQSAHESLEPHVQGVVRGGGADIEAQLGDGVRDLRRSGEVRVAGVGTSLGRERHLRLADGHIGGADVLLNVLQLRQEVHLTVARVLGIHLRDLPQGGVPEQVAGDVQGHGARLGRFSRGRGRGRGCRRRTTRRRRRCRGIRLTRGEGRRRGGRVVLGCHGAAGRQESDSEQGGTAAPTPAVGRGRAG